MNCNDIASILKQDMIRGKLLYSEHVLSIGLGFSEATRVGRQSLSSACRNALVEYTKHDGVELPPHYSRSFMKVMRKIKAVHNRPKPIYRILQRAAIFLVVFGISFGIAISVNAELRESVFRWIVETFPQFSKFSLQADQSTEEPSYEELLLYKPTFIPDGYVEVPIDNFPPDVYYIYEDDEGNILAIIGCVPGSGPISLNTEGVSPEITTFRGEEAFYWNKDGITYLSLVIDGYQFSISGQISRDIIVNIAENIKRM
jgi:hypothetical protein